MNVLSAEIASRLLRFREEATARARKLGPLTQVARDEIVSGVDSIYRAVGLPPVPTVFVSSPRIGTLAAGLAAALWHFDESGAGATAVAATNAGVEPDILDVVARVRGSRPWPTTMQVDMECSDPNLPCGTVVGGPFWTAMDNGEVWSRVSRGLEPLFHSLWDSMHFDLKLAFNNTPWRSGAMDDIASTTRLPWWIQVEREICHWPAPTAQWAKLAYRMRDMDGPATSHVAMLEFFLANPDIFKLAEVANLALWRHYRHTLKAGPRWYHRRFCVVSEPPTQLSLDDQGRPHSEDGPCVQWADGSALFAAHGVFYRP